MLYPRVVSGPGHDASCVLRDGRIIEYWDGGDPEGRGVIFHPGTPVTRLLGRWGHQAAVSAQVRLVAVNRPGYGGSTPSTVPSLMDTGRDTAALAAAVGLEQYAVIGSSGGGPFAVATAVADPHGVRAIGLVGGMGPWRVLNEPSDKDSEDRGYLALLDNGDTAAAWAGMHQSAEQEMRHLATLDDEARVDAFFENHDGALTRNVKYRAIWAANLAHVIDSPEGYVLDNLAWGGTWDVDPTDVVAPTLLWYSEDDRDCPASSHGHWYNERIDGSELVMVVGEGHVDVIDGHWPDVLAGLLHIWT
jgi:pimeloyl-ACP methyl ester carboxylesterase